MERKRPNRLRPAISNPQNLNPPFWGVSVSEECQILLQRIQRFGQPIEEPPKPSEALTHLLNRMETRRWVEETLSTATETLKEIKNGLKFIKHARKCEQCLFELQIGVERYGGSHHGLWYLDLINEEAYDEMDDFWSQRPRVQDYEIGSYWNGTSKDTIRFIKDRMTWAEGIMQKQKAATSRLIRVLKRWDGKGPGVQELEKMADECLWPSLG